MSNPSNLIRPPVLGNTTPVAPAGPSGSGTQISPELAHLVKNVVTLILQTDGQSIIQSILNNGTNQNIRDQTIDERYRDNMNEMDKIPDVVRSRGFFRKRFRVYLLEKECRADSEDIRTLKKHTKIFRNFKCN